ncbi:hypothetical protein [Bacteroides rodentium]
MKTIRHIDNDTEKQKRVILPPPAVNMFNQKNISAHTAAALQASACSRRKHSTGQALVVSSAQGDAMRRTPACRQADAYEAPLVEVLEVACEAGYAVSLGGWDATEDLTPEGGGEMN